MTRGGVKEYLDAVPGRYLKGDRKGKSPMLDEVAKSIQQKEPSSFRRKPESRERRSGFRRRSL